MTCAKQQVVCFIWVKTRTEPFVGSNHCVNPQTTCPRLPGEGYRKCFSICGQLGHAEDVALRQMRLAGFTPADVIHITVLGHYGPCESCRALLDSLGLLHLTTFINEPATITNQERAAIEKAFALDAALVHKEL